MVLNIPLVNEVMRTMSIAMKNEKLDFNYFAEMALNQINQMRKRAKEYADSIKSGDYVHKNADIEADIFAPVVILPQDIFDAKQRYVKIDLGRITVGSDLQVHDKKKDYKAMLDENMVYDVYKLNLKKINLQVIEFVDQKQQNCKILQDVNLGLTIKNCLEPLHPVHPTFRVDMTAETPISIEIVDVFDFLKRLLELKESLLVQLYSKDYNIIKQKKLSDFNAQARRATKARGLQQTEEQSNDEDTMKLIRKKTMQRRPKKRASLDDDEASDEGGDRQIAEKQGPRGEGERSASKKQLPDKLREREENSLAEDTGEQPKGAGTNVHCRFHVSQMRIVLGTQESKDQDHQKKAEILLHETDRFIFEMRELSMLTQMDKQSSMVTLDMGI